jgi:hypothetical protein
MRTRTLKHLPIERDECVQKIEEAVSMANSLRMHTRRVLPEIKSCRKWQELIDEVYSTVEAAEDEIGTYIAHMRLTGARQIVERARRESPYCSLEQSFGVPRWRLSEDIVWSNVD